MMFDKSHVPCTQKRGVIISLFKGKGHKASYKDHYRGLTLLPVLSKLFETIMANRLISKFNDIDFPNCMQFGFEKGLSCSDANFVMREAVFHYLESKSKVFACFLDVKKAFDTVWINGLLYKLYWELGVTGKMWLMLRNLYSELS